MSIDSSKIFNKAWNYAQVLRDDGPSYMAHTEQITFLLFLKVADELSRWHSTGRDSQNETSSSSRVDGRVPVADSAGMQVGNASQRAARLRQVILKRAYAGKLVPQELNAEFATVLLDCIKTASDGNRSASGNRQTPRRRASV
jgi:hypothetical protein